MRIAIVSDIHGNLTALDAVIADLERQAPDLVLHGGDLVLMGAQPVEVIERVQELGWQGVVGNTDEALWRPEEQERLQKAAPQLTPLLNLIFGDYAPATVQLIGSDRVAWLRELPFQQRVADIALVHASPQSLWQAPMPDADDEQLAFTYESLAAPTAVYGHIHRPFARTVQRHLTVVNSGSVGMPWDDDPRAAYLLIDDGRPRTLRVEYDVEREARLLARSGYPDAARLAEMRRRGAFIQPGLA